MTAEPTSAPAASLPPWATPDEGILLARRGVSAIDDALFGGLARLGVAQRDALETLSADLPGTPLHAPLSGALEAFARSEMTVASVAVLAAVRAALLGAEHDAWLSRLPSALGLPPAPSLPPPSIDTHLTPLGDSVRHWLVELATEGLGRFEPSSVAPFSATLDRLQEDPSQARLAALLTGLVGELDAAGAPEERPRQRWSDLWMRSMIVASRGAVADPSVPVAGSFVPWGLELRSHPHFVSAVVHGVLDAGPGVPGEPSGGPPAGRVFARVTMGAWKVGVVVAAEAVGLLRPRHDVLLDAVRDRSALQFSGTLGPAGELAGSFSPGAPAPGNAFSEGPGAVVPHAPLDRHPMTIAVPVRATLKEGMAEIGTAGGQRGLFPLRGGISTDGSVGGATTIVGLLRHDGDWFVQPLSASTVKGKKTTETSIAALVDVDKKQKKLAVPQLRERAGRLLRK